jgi:hypothetical protein
MLHVKPTELLDQYRSRLSKPVLLEDHNVLRALRHPVIVREMMRLEADLPNSTVRWVGSLPTHKTATVRVSVVLSDGESTISLIVDYQPQTNRLESVSRRFGTFISNSADNIPFALLAPSLTEVVSIDDRDENLNRIRQRREEFTSTIAKMLPTTSYATPYPTTSETGYPTAENTPYPTTGVTTPNDNDTRTDERGDSTTDTREDTQTDTQDDGDDNGDE